MNENWSFDQCEPTINPLRFRRPPNVRTIFDNEQ
jgi:hypothetical protein